MSEQSLHTTLTAEINTEMQLEIAGLNHRIKLSLVGLLKGQYLLFSIPQKLIDSIGIGAFTVGLPVNVRCISRGAAFGFHSSIAHMNQVPTKLLFLEYPEGIQRHKIRKAQRVKCLLPAEIQQEQIKVSGNIADISRSGCHFQAKVSNFGTDEAALAKAGGEVNIKIAIPGVNGHQSIKSSVKNFAMDVEKVQIGLEFLSVEPEIIAMIDEFVAMSFDLEPF